MTRSRTSKARKTAKTTRSGEHRTTPPGHVAGPRKTTLTEMIRARIDPELKVEAETILNDLGLNASDAIRLFYKQVTLRRGLPFEVEIPNAETRKALRDADAGKGLTRHVSVDDMFKKLGV
jgi:DNA-damage-inducible protein J